MAKSKIDNICHWLQTRGKYHPIVWKTDCNRLWFYQEDGDAYGNRFAFCPFCGGVIKIVENSIIRTKGKSKQLSLL